MNTDPKLPTMLLGALAVLLVAAGGPPLIRAAYEHLHLALHLPYRTPDLVLVLSGAGIAALAVRRARHGR